MFDIGPAELLLIFVVALLVIGPERLPAAVKTASLWIGRFRRSFYKIKSEVERELNADEIRRQLHNESILAEVEDAKKQAKDLADDIGKTASLEDNQSADSKGTAEREDDTGLAADTADPGSPPPVESDGAVPPQPGSATAKNSDATARDSSIKGELRQAVNYVNDISREVDTTRKEIEEQLGKSGNSDSSSGDKS